MGDAGDEVAAATSVPGGFLQPVRHLLEARTHRQHLRIAALRICLVVGLLAAACSGSDDSDGADDGDDANEASEVVTAEISPGEAFTVTIEGYGTIEGSASTVSTGGEISVAPVSALDPPDAIDDTEVVSSGPGLRVDLGSAVLREPVTVSLPAPTSAAGEVTGVAHVSDSGTWTWLEAQDAGDEIEVTTDEFSIIASVTARLPGIDSILDSFTGRTDPPDCGPAPGWASAIPAPSGSVHACVRDTGGGTVELEIKSNRGWFQWVKLPANLPRTFVWVEDGPDWLRDLVGNVSKTDPTTTVLLPPGKRMTVGYAQPATASTLAFDTYADEWSLWASLATETIGYVGVDDGALALFLMLWCFDSLDIDLNAGQPAVSWPQLSSSTVSCLIDKVTDFADDRLAAVAEAEGWLAGQGTPTDVTQLADGLQKAGRLAQILELGGVAARSITYAIDAAIGTFGLDNATDVTLQLDRTALPPPSTVDDGSAALAFFRSTEATCADHADQTSNPRVDPARFADARAMSAQANGVWVIVDGLGDELTVDLNERVIYGSKGPAGELPSAYTFGCPEDLYLGGADL